MIQNFQPDPTRRLLRPNDNSILGLSILQILQISDRNMHIENMWVCIFFNLPSIIET